MALRRISSCSPDELWWRSSGVWRRPQQPTGVCCVIYWRGEERSGEERGGEGRGSRLAERREAQREGGGEARLIDGLSPPSLQRR
eukprot:361377-Hanusia_phi.AAC.1